MEVAVIIPVTRSQELHACLQALLVQNYPHGQYEILLVVSEGLRVAVPDTDVKVTLIIENKLHTGLRRNKAAAKTDAGYFAFVDDDTVVPQNWLQDAVRSIKDRDVDGVCGRIVHFKADNTFSKRLSGAAIDSFILEGFTDSCLQEAGRADYYNIPLCNCMIKRAVWETVKGFNETAYYYMDDLEFFYLADRKGKIFYHIPELAVAHGVEPFPLKYLRKKYNTRFHVGINTFIFGAAYGNMLFVRLALVSYPFLGVLLYYAVRRPAILLFLSGMYLFLTYSFSLKYFRKDFPVFLCLPFVFFMTHAVNFTAFSCGLISYVCNRRSYKNIVMNKEIRFS
jgi:GT2 family glycosyltransferase